MTLHKIQVCSRVDLYFCDTGFEFTNRLTIPQVFRDWKDWPAYWPLYERDNIRVKLLAYLRALPDRFKCQTFYQAIHF